MGAKSLALLKHWDKLKVQGGIMYRETRDPVSKVKRVSVRVASRPEEDSTGRSSRPGWPSRAG